MRFCSAYNFRARFGPGIFPSSPLFLRAKSPPIKVEEGRETRGYVNKEYAVNNNQTRTEKGNTPMERRPASRPRSCGQRTRFITIWRPRSMSTWSSVPSFSSAYQTPSEGSVRLETEPQPIRCGTAETTGRGKASMVLRHGCATARSVEIRR